MAANLFRSGSITSAMTLVSRVFGLLREVLVANLLGAAFAADVFLLVQKIPNFLRRLFAEGAFAQAFVPVLAEYHRQRPREELLALLNKVSGTLGAILLAVTVLGMVGSSVVVSVYAPAWIDEPEKFELASSLLRITFPYLLFISLTALAGSVLNSIGRFAVPAVTPTLLSVCQIAAALLVAPGLDQQAYALAWAIFGAGVLQLAVQLPFLWREGLLPRPQWGWSDPGVQRILKLMLPAMFGVSVAQMSLLLDAIFLTFLPTGSVSWLYYADRLLEFPLGVFGIAVATVVLPALSREHAGAESVQFHKTMDWGLRLLLVIGLPATVGLIVLSDGLVFTVFQHGKFTVADTSQTAHALIAYSLGLLSFMWVKVLASGFFAKQDTRTPVRIGIISLAVNMVMNAILMWPLGHVGLALSSAISGTLNAVLLYRALRQRGIYTPQAGWLRWFAIVMVASLAMAAGLLWLNPVHGEWASMSIALRMGWTALLVAVGAAIYAAALLLAGMRLRELRAH